MVGTRVLLVDHGFAVVGVAIRMEEALKEASEHLPKGLLRERCRRGGARRVEGAEARREVAIERLVEVALGREAYLELELAIGIGVIQPSLFLVCTPLPVAVQEMVHRSRV